MVRRNRLGSLIDEELSCDKFESRQFFCAFSLKGFSNLQLSLIFEKDHPLRKRLLFMVAKKEKEEGICWPKAKAKEIISVSHSSFHDPILPLFLFRCHRDVFAGHIRIHGEW